MGERSVKNISVPPIFDQMIVQYLFQSRQNYRREFKLMQPSDLFNHLIPV